MRIEMKITGYLIFLSANITFSGCDRPTFRGSLLNDAAQSNATGTCDDFALNNKEEHVDCGGPNCPVCTDKAKSCKALLERDPTAPTGIYQIDSDGSGPEAFYSTYCEMSADGGGWTLAMKLDGNQTTFVYDAPAWVDRVPIGDINAALDTQEAKLASFNLIPFRDIRVGFVNSTETRWLTLPINTHPPQTLQQVFAAEYKITTHAGRDTWLALIADSSIQPNCNDEGLNVRSLDGFASRIRIGILGNDQDDCTSPDSFLGIGSYSGVTVGNNSYGPQNPAFAYVMVRE